MYYTNPALIQLNRIFDQNERKSYIRLDLNENPVGLPEEFIQEVLSKVTPRLISQYPETSHFADVLANHLHCDSSNICLVNGSAEGIRYLIQAFTSPEGRIVGVVPSYFMFQIYSEMYERKFVKVNYESDLSMNVDNIIRELTPETQMLILLNPNNPMGNTYTEEEFRNILEAAQKNEVTILIDEAYHYFYPNTFIEYALNNERVFVTRTFSKLFSLAGCRLGYIVGKPEGIKIVQKLCTPHNTNAFALLFAEELLTHPTMLTQLIEIFNEGRKFLVESLDKEGYPHKGDAGNFIFIKPRTDAKEIVRRMKEERKILIKSYDNVGEYGTCLRVSIGGKEIMEKFFDALIELDK